MTDKNHRGEIGEFRAALLPQPLFLGIVVSRHLRKHILIIYIKGIDQISDQAM